MKPATICLIESFYLPEYRRRFPKVISTCLKYYQAIKSGKTPNAEDFKPGAKLILDQLKDLKEKEDTVFNIEREVLYEDLVRSIDMHHVALTNRLKVFLAAMKEDKNANLN